MSRRSLFRLDQIGRTRYAPSPRPTSLSEAVERGAQISIVCNSCSHEKIMDAHIVARLLREKRRLNDAPFGHPVMGFFCNEEKRSVTVTFNAARQ